MDFNFLTHVAASGENCFVGFTPSRETPGKLFARHVWTDFRNQEATTHAYQELQRAGAQGIYFAPAGFGVQSRTQDQCQGLRSFFVDLDAGEAKLAKHGADKVYLTAEEAHLDLHDKLDGVFPKPTYVIHSGTGIHAYWTMVEDVPFAQWKQLAQKFKLFCRLHGLKIDPARTGDGASIMRVVGSLHQSAHRTVSVLECNSLFFKEDLVNAIEQLQVSVAPTRSSVPSDYEHGDLLQQVTHKPCSFGKIIETTELTGEGCRALYDIYKNQDKQTYQEWIAILSVANRCIDRDEWIHKVSSGYPGYSYDATEAKAASLKAPFKCTDIMAIDPSRCAGCPLAGKIVSPITIGRNPESKPVKVTAQLGTDKNKQEEFVIPPYPYPFFRGKEGGIFIEEENDDTGTVDKYEVFPYDFYIYERIGSSGKQLYWCRYHSPHDGVKEFDMDSTMIHSITAEMKDCLTGQGMAVTSKKQWGYMSMFLQQFNKQLVESKAALREIEQQGWQYDDKGNVTAFVHGKEEVTTNGVKPAPIGDRQIAKKLSVSFTPKYNGDEMSSLEKWNYCLHNMYHTKASLPNQLIICSSLGAAFASRFALANDCGGVISLASTASGRGKTYTCQTALRVWAKPADLTFASKSGVTVNALMTNLGYANSLPILRDEITEMAPEEIADLIYDSTRLGDKERAQGSENDIRGHRNSWRTFFYVTSNRSLYDTIAAERTDGDGPMMRVTELMIGRTTFLDQKDARRLAKEIDTVHGVAGRFLLEWMVRHPEEAERLWNTTLEQFVQETGAVAAERFWVTHLVSACVGAKIGEALNLHPFKASDVVEHAKDVLEVMRSRVKTRTSETLVDVETEDGEVITVDAGADMAADEETIALSQQAAFLGAFINDNINRTMVIKGAGMPIMPKSNEVFIRIEQNTGFVYVRVDALRTYCFNHRISNDMVSAIMQHIGAEKRSFRMMSGTDMATASVPVRVWKIPGKRLHGLMGVAAEAYPRYDGDALLSMSYGEIYG